MLRLSKKNVSGMLCILFSIQVLLLAVTFPQVESYRGGWVEPKLALISDPFLLTEVPAEWRGKGQGQVRLLSRDYEQIHGRPYAPRNQGRAPSCVGQAAAAAVDFLAAVEIVAGEPERYPPSLSSAEVIYGLSRIEIGGLDETAGGGSFNLWACRALREYGSVPLLNYPLIGEDLSKPSSVKAIRYGAEGIPLGLELIAKRHPIRDYVKISSYEDLRDAIALGYPVIIGSSQGFGEGKLTRDEDGFLNPPRRVFFPSVWNHSMVCVGVADTGRKGALILNSWGTQWISGPHRFEDCPEGSFFVDHWIIDRMVKQGDSYALRGFNGYIDFSILSN